MKIITFASCQKTYNYLQHIHWDLIKRNHKSFFLYSESNDTAPPPNNYKANANSGDIQEEDAPESQTLGIKLPFVPDYLIVARDRWNPELSIINEFKNRFNTKICLVEINTPTVFAIESKMEYISRKNQGNEFIDVNFNHCKNDLNVRKKHIKWKGWDKSVVVGNPYWDKWDKWPIDGVSKQYKVDKNKTQLLFFSEQNITRPDVLRSIQYFSRNVLDKNKYQLYFKPYPAEPWHPLFEHQYKKNEDGSIKFFLDDFFDGVIYNQQDLIPMMNICEYHIGNISSVNYGSVLMNKQLVSLENITNYVDKCTNLDLMKSNMDNVGDTWKSKFWMNIHNLTEKEFDDLALENLDEYKKYNELFKKDLYKYCHMLDVKGNFLNDDKKDTSKLLKYFDDFGDGKAGSRIVDHLEKIA